MDIADDPRFLAAIRHFDEEDFFEAAELFEELFFETVRDEVEFVRLFLQLSAGIHHVDRGQLNAATERLEVALQVVEDVTNPRGFDLARIASETQRIIDEIHQRRGGNSARITWPKLAPRASGEPQSEFHA